MRHASATVAPGTNSGADAWRIASEIYAKDGLPPVSDLDAFHAAYLPGRGPNTTRLAHPQQQDQQQQQTQSGAEGEQKPQENGQPSCAIRLIAGTPSIW